MKRLYVLLILFFAYSFTYAQTNENSDDSTAAASAFDWLNVVDEGMYSQSWELGGKQFRGSVTKNQWTQAVSSVREPLGKLSSREIKSKKYSKELPGMPDGSYYSFEFNSSFKNKKESVETLTLMKDGEEWKVIGYFIR